MVLKDVILAVSNFGRGVVVLKDVILAVFVWECVVVLKRTDF